MKRKETGTTTQIKQKKNEHEKEIRAKEKGERRKKQRTTIWESSF